MGITIHYRGMIDRIEDVAKLSSEIREFATILKWDIRQWTNNWHLPNSAALERCGNDLKLSGHVPIRGVSLVPTPDCEPLFFTFTRDGILASSTNMVMMADQSMSSEDLWLSTKTQFSTVDIHIALIRLLQFVKSKYISNLEVHDGSGYWKHRDRELLIERFQTVGAAIKTIPDTLNLIPKSELQNKTPEEIADFIEDIIKKKYGK
jgi:hypothetical protein